MLIEPRAYVGVAFFRGNPRFLWDRVIMGTTSGPFVHTEFFLERGEDVRFYTAANLVDQRFKAASGFMPSARMHNLPESSQWEVVRYPVTLDGYFLTYSLILQLLALQLPYNARDLWQCCISFMLPYERDLDCDRFETFKPGGVFCSQVCLLLLRRLQNQGVLPKDLPVQSVNSRGCSPNALHRLLLPPEKKDTNQCKATPATPKGSILLAP